MTGGEIVAEALRRGLVQTKGKTPEATMLAELYLHARETGLPLLKRVFEPGPTRARRGSVRWAVIDAPVRFSSKENPG